MSKNRKRVAITAGGGHQIAGNGAVLYRLLVAIMLLGHGGSHAARGIR